MTFHEYNSQLRNKELLPVITELLQKPKTESHSVTVTNVINCYWALYRKLFYGTSIESLLAFYEERIGLPMRFFGHFWYALLNCPYRQSSAKNNNNVQHYVESFHRIGHIYTQINGFRTELQNFANIIQEEFHDVNGI